MAKSTRRNFLKTSSVVTAALASQRAGLLRASALGLPVGLQLYSVREFLPTDYLGTLKQLSAMGYREVEAAGFFDHSAADVKRMMGEAGLHCVSAHYPSQKLYPDVDSIIEYGKELGLEYIVCSFPGIKDPSRLKDTSHQSVVRSFTMEDWRWNAEQFNLVGAKVNAAGMKFAYHNHTMEFHAQDGAVPFDELMRLTDPAKVAFELDCGWVVIGGGSPEECLRRYSSRIRMLHIKDFKSNKPLPSGEPPAPAEVGQGALDIRKILSAARQASIRHCFIEQEGFDMPWKQSLQIDADYMKKA